MAFWRVLSVVGLAIVLVVSLVESFSAEPLQYRSLIWLIAGSVLVPVVMRVFFADSLRALIRNPDLLVPVGVAWLATTVLGWLVLLPVLGQLFLFGWVGNVFGIGLTMSVFAALNLLVWAAFACWQIDLIWQWANKGQVVDLSPWPSVRRGIWKAAVVLFLGHAIMLALLIPAMAMGLAGFLIFGLLIGFFWNLTTVALLPIVLSGAGGFLPSVKQGFQASWKLKYKWWMQLAAQLLLLGLVTYVAVSYREGGTFRSEYSFGANVFWVGAFEYSFRWHTKYMAMIKSSPLPVVVAMLDMLLIGLAIAMKIHVIRALRDCSTVEDVPRENGTKGMQY